jgi:flavodoxin
MEAVVIFDSTWGNTEKIAQAVASGIGGNTKALRVGAAGEVDLAHVDLLVLGSPILGGRPSPAMQAFVNAVSTGAANKLRVATFDTRLVARFAKIFGFAALRMADSLKKKGYDVRASEGFFVRGRSGPLADGEVERATQWGRGLLAG